MGCSAVLSLRRVLSPGEMPRVVRFEPVLLWCLAPAIGQLCVAAEVSQTGSLNTGLPTVCAGPATAQALLLRWVLPPTVRCDVTPVTCDTGSCAAFQCLILPLVGYMLYFVQCFTLRPPMGEVLLSRFTVSPMGYVAQYFMFPTVLRPRCFAAGARVEARYFGAST